MKEKNAYIFFNCDEEKSQKSMNLFYNKEIYRDLKLARRASTQRLKRNWPPAASTPKKKTSRPSAKPS